MRGVTLLGSWHEASRTWFSLFRGVVPGICFAREARMNSDSVFMSADGRMTRLACKAMKQLHGAAR